MVSYGSPRAPANARKHPPARAALERQHISLAYVTANGMIRVQAMQANPGVAVAYIDSHCFARLIGEFVHQREQDVAQLEAVLV